MSNDLFTDAMSELNEKYIMEAATYKGKAKTAHNKRKHWIRAAACLAVLAVAFGIIPFFNQSGTSPFVLTAYALEADNSVFAFPMVEGKYIPVSLFETENDLKGFVFSYDAPDPSDPASILIRNMNNPVSVGESINEIGGLETEQGKVYIYYILPEDATAPYNLPTFITDAENDTVYQFNIVIEESDNGYTAELLEVAQYERKTK